MKASVAWQILSPKPPCQGSYQVLNGRAMVCDMTLELDMWHAHQQRPR